MNEIFERFVDDIKFELAHCLRGVLSEFDMPSIGDPDQLKEQFEEHYLAGKTCEDIDWKTLEKELNAFAEEVRIEYHKRKRIEDEEEAIRAGRL